MWLNFFDASLNFRLQGVGGRVLVGINLRSLKNPKGKSATALDDMIWAAN